MLDIFERGESINYVTLANELGRSDQLRSVDGLSYLVLLSEGMPALANLERFCTIVREKAILPGTILSCRDLIKPMPVRTGRAERPIGRSGTRDRDSELQFSRTRSPNCG